VLCKIIDEFKPQTLEDIRYIVGAQLLMIGTTFKMVPQDPGFLNREGWVDICTRIEQMLELISRPEYKESLLKSIDYLQNLVNNNTDTDREMTVEAMEAEAEEKAQYETEQQVFPSLSNFAERLDENLWKSYQRTQHGSINYMVRLQDENRLLFLSDRLLTYLQEFNQYEDKSRVGLIKLQYVYFKSDQMYKRIEERFASQGQAVSASVYICQNSTQVIQELVSLV